jgi:FixJ family two-component response regulator
MSVQAAKAGAVECLTKPDGDQTLLLAIGQAAECDAWHAGSARTWWSCGAVTTR